MKRLVRKIVERLIIVALKIKQPSTLICFMFHEIFDNADRLNDNIIRPGQGITVDDFEYFVEYYKRLGFEFISPSNLNKLKPKHRYVLITFDDGYYNNTKILDSLNKYNVPAIFFVTTNWIENNICNWSHSLYRQLLKKGLTTSQINYEITKLKKETHNNIEKRMINSYGKNALCPISDMDRMLTPLELIDMINNPMLEIGNHTSDHGILTNYSNSSIYKQIKSAQEYLASRLKQAPSAIAYPNGNYNDSIINMASNEGIKYGFTTEQDIVDTNNIGCMMTIPRLHFNGYGRLRIDRSQIMIKEVIRAILKH